MDFNPPIVKKGRLVASGASIVMTMPPEWISENGLSVGDEVIIVSNGDLKIMKMEKENIARLRSQLSNHTRPSSVVTEQEKSAVSQGT